jgi:hypothetical protein
LLQTVSNLKSDTPACTGSDIGKKVGVLSRRGWSWIHSSETIICIG